VETVFAVGLFADEFTKFKMQDLFTVREYPVWQLAHTIPPPNDVVEVQAFGIQTDKAMFTDQRNASLKQVKQLVA